MEQIISLNILEKIFVLKIAQMDSMSNQMEIFANPVFLLALLAVITLQTVLVVKINLG